MIQKKLFFLVLTALFALTACSGGGKSDEVEITLPASLFMGDVDAAVENAKSRGVTDVTVNDDNTVTFVLSAEEHEKLMKDLKDEVVKSAEEMLTSGDYMSVKDITFNDDFSEFTMMVDRAAYEDSLEGFGALALAISGAIYQAFDGVPADEVSVTVNIQDFDTGEVFDSFEYPNESE